MEQASAVRVSIGSATRTVSGTAAQLCAMLALFADKINAGEKMAVDFGDGKYQLTVDNEKVALTWNLDA